MKTIEPKILKGTQDFLPSEMVKRKFVMNKFAKTFERFGYDPIETPSICPAETILGKYGDEANKLVYTFDDAGGRRVALPYDLTVPFARLVAANKADLPMPFKRYQIQKVWRAEKPQKGRLREFYQCDIDIIGTKSLVAEAEIAKVTIAVLEDLGIDNFVMKINSRRLINNILSSFGVSELEVVQIIRIIDKLDKIGEGQVIEQMGALGVAKASEILEILKPERNNLKTSEKLRNYDLSEINKFLEFCENFSIPEDYIKFDPTLARGLDYYTGLIYEVTVDGCDVGSVAGGGRYDNLSNLFSKEPLSGVGLAVGFDRIMLVLEEQKKLTKNLLNSRVLVTLFDENSISGSLKIYSLLTEAGINSEIFFEPVKLKKQFKYADKKQIPFVIICGPDEFKKDSVTIKNMKNGKQKTILINQLITYLKGYYEN